MKPLPISTEIKTGCRNNNNKTPRNNNSTNNKNRKMMTLTCSTEDKIQSTLSNKSASISSHQVSRRRKKNLTHTSQK